MSMVSDPLLDTGIRSNVIPPVPASDTICRGYTKFTDRIIDHRFCVQNETILLQHHPDVFPPSLFGLNFAEQIDFNGFRRAADIGTGTGLIAILAGKKGVAEIKATDTSELALRLTDYNAREMNGVDVIETSHGPFFSDLQGTFDVITANLPQEIIPPGYRADLNPFQLQAIDGGGPGGNAILLNFLEVVPVYMHGQTKLYIIVNTITDYKKILGKIADRFQASLVWEGQTNTKAFVQENIGFFQTLIDEGIVSLVKNSSGNWQVTQFIFELSLRP